MGNGSTRASFSLPSILAILAAIGSFATGAIWGLILAVIAIVLGIIGVVLSFLPSVRGGIVSVVGVIAGFIGIIAAAVKGVSYLAH